MIEVYFDPSQYQVLEGGSVAITLKVNRTFSVAFDVNVTLMDITAIGRSSLFKLHISYYVMSLALLWTNATNAFWP